MSNRLSPLIRIRTFCLGLPGATEVLQFGHPFFKVRDKPFAIYSHQAGQELSIKVEKQSQPVFLADPRFRKTPYL
ncbi:MAG: MmcQ/YjbR family DNA-binding protein, partial [Acidobacteriota bacterium]